MPIRVKICGIQSMVDAQICINAGAHAVGFLVGVTHETEDEILPDQCKGIVEKMPPFVSKVLVTHLMDPSEIISMAKFTGVDTVQLHEDLPTERLIPVRLAMPWLRLVKALHVHGTEEECIERALELEQHVDALLVDTKAASRVGEKALTHTWRLSAEIGGALAKPLILSGGLNPENLEEALKMVKPYAVDVNSGVEDKDGRKDLEKVRAFIRIVRRAV